MQAIVLTFGRPIRVLDADVAELLKQSNSLHVSLREAALFLDKYLSLIFSLPHGGDISAKQNVNTVILSLINYLRNRFVESYLNVIDLY